MLSPDLNFFVVYKTVSSVPSNFLFSTASSFRGRPRFFLTSPSLSRGGGTIDLPLGPRGYFLGLPLVSFLARSGILSSELPLSCFFGPGVPSFLVVPMAFLADGSISFLDVALVLVVVRVALVVAFAFAFVFFDEATLVLALTFETVVFAALRFATLAPRVVGLALVGAFVALLLVVRVFRLTASSSSTSSSSTSLSLSDSTSDSSSSDFSLPSSSPSVGLPSSSS